ncbi:myosin-binding protein 1-like [Typha angustifolia]|uniref:myosin-binding protein 1-like n=1 Tax=Typha angustifolia TaxID=59011 RepID=UPI003C2B51B7
MAARLCNIEHRNSHRFSAALSSAVLEWVLMLLLFLDALFSYFVTRFARACKLQVPCLLCSRLDHILGNEKPGFYKNLICNAHKSEISSLAFCHIHQKLADVHDMCERCLFSFATEKKSNPETYRALVGKLGVVIDDIGEDYVQKAVDRDDAHDTFQGKNAAEIPLLDDSLSCCQVERDCSCCSEPLKNKAHAIRLYHNKSSELDVADIVSSHQHHQTSLEDTEDKSLDPKDIYHLCTHDVDPLSHIGYSEVKVTSDSESDIPFSDDGDKKELAHDDNDLKEDFVAQDVQSEAVEIKPNNLLTTCSDVTELEKVIPPIVSEPFESIPEKQLHVGESRDISSLASAIATEHASDELYYSRSEEKASQQPTELILEDSLKVPSEDSQTKDNFQQVHVAQDIVTSSGEYVNASNSDEINCKTNQITSDLALSLNTGMSLNDAYKLATGNKDSLTSPSFAEVIMGKDSSRAHEDLKLLISQISASQGLESPWNDSNFSPRVHGQDDYFVLQNITNRLSIERNESGMESLEGSIVSEIEGESVVDRLRRQVALDRKSISLLYKELEEERNASAIATNQAMAMITRLQEEKAAMQMEALHYQRMMEEQAEYDHEAMQKCNEILAQRDKELQELEAELEKYRLQFRGELLAVKPSEVRKLDPTLELQVPVALEMLPKDYGSSESSLLKRSLESFDDEKAYILNCLKKLEQKLHIFSNNGALFDASKFSAKEDELSEKTCEDVDGENCDQRMPIVEDNTRRNCRYLVYASAGDVDPLQSSEDPNLRTDFPLSTTQAQFIVQGNQGGGLFDNKGQYFAMIAESDLAAFEDEISDLSERLTTLEADHNFLEHSVNSLRYGDEGVQLIRDIACHLRELRAIGIK